MKRYHFVGIDDGGYVAPMDIIADSFQQAKKIVNEYKCFGITDVEFCGSEVFTPEDPKEV